MSAGLQVVKLYLPASIQDCGRRGYSHWGIPHSGVMDMHAFRQVNSLLCNHQEAAVLEFTTIGPDLLCYKSGVFSISASGFTSKLNGIPLETGTCFKMTRGDTLSLGRSETHKWGYLGVKGGFLSPIRLGSRSYHSSLYLKPLSLGEMVPYRASSTNSGRGFSQDQGVCSVYDIFINVYQGPEFGLLPGYEKRKLFKGHFTISAQTNRMAYPLTGNKIVFPLGFSMDSSGVFPGVIQLLPSGELLILMRDAQRTGGYPRILVADPHQLSALAQRLPGSIVKFRLQKD